MLSNSRIAYKTLINPINYSFSSGQTHRVTMFPGDGIGPEISQAVLDIFTAAKIPIEWEFHKIHSASVSPDGDLIAPEAIESIRKNKFALKGPFTTPIGKGHRSLNVTLRKKLQLFANVRPCKSLPGLKTLYDNVDVVTIRENTEGEYSGLEHKVVPGVVENLKIISKNACENIAEYAFQYAVNNNRKNVTACHKAGVQQVNREEVIFQVTIYPYRKMGDGLFVNTCREIAAKYPQIDFKEEQVDTICMKLARDPSELDVMVMPNLYGDIVSDLCAGLIGGLGLTSSGNIGQGVAVFEAVHGSAPDIAGKNLANPTALLLSALMMLDRMGMEQKATMIRNAVFGVYTEGKYITGDVGGKATCTDFVSAIIDRLE